MLLLNTTYELPDGNNITVDAKRFRCTEFLFLQASIAFGQPCFLMLLTHMIINLVRFRVARLIFPLRVTRQEPRVPLGTRAVQRTLMTR